MSNTYEWKINQLECYPQHESYSDVVFTIRWDRLATDGNGHNARIYGSQAITLDAGAPFTPFEQLTEAQVIGWLEDAMGPELLATQIAALDQMIADQINPPVASLFPPWAPPPPFP